MLENIKKTVTNYAKNAWNKKVNKDKLLENRISSDMVFEGVNLANLDLSDKTFKNVKFINCDLSGVDFTRSTFKNVTFENCNCNNSIFREANVFDSDFQASYFDNANFKESTINNTNIELSDFRSASFQNTSFSSANGKPIDNSNFNDADFTNAYFCDYKVSNSKFRRANLPDNIHKCEFIKSDLRDTNIQNIELDAVKFEDTLMNTGVISKAKGDALTKEGTTNGMVASMNTQEAEGLKEKTRFPEFHSLPELMALLQQYASNMEKNAQQGKGANAEAETNDKEKVNLAKEESKAETRKETKEEIKEVGADKADKAVEKAKPEIKVANEAKKVNSPKPAKANDPDPFYDDDSFASLMQSEPSPEELEDDSYNNYAYETRSDSKNPVNSYSFNAKKEIETSLNEKDFEKSYKTVLKLGGTIKSFLSKVIEHFGANQNALHDAVQSVTNVENKSTEYAAKLLNDTLNTPEYRKAFEKTQENTQKKTR